MIVAIEEGAGLHGLSVVGALHPEANDLVPDACKTLILLGPSGPEMWAAFSASSEAADGEPNPMDRWSERVISDLAARLGGTAFFPFGGPPWQPFQRWATRGEGALPSPVGMQASAKRGLWVSYRGAIALQERLEIDLPPSSPCSTCAAPCLTACPVNAFASGIYDVPRCVSYLNAHPKAPCHEGCLVRRACPPGAEVNLPTSQRAFHMLAFVKANSDQSNG